MQKQKAFVQGYFMPIVIRKDLTFGFFKDILFFGIVASVNL
jgi:hypothetical protein